MTAPLAHPSQSQRFAVRARILHFLDDPKTSGEKAYDYYEDGILLIENGHVAQVGSADSVLKTLPKEIDLKHYPHHLVMPGFIDTHIHYPQSHMIASYGEKLLEWLERYTFPTEMQFANKTHASAVSDFFFKQLLSNGTTTAMVFCTVHPTSVDAFFERAQALGLRMIAGKVLMDRNAPKTLLDPIDKGLKDSCELIERWHGQSRLQYAITPRFAPTSTQEQLTMAGDLLQKYDRLYVQTHLAENQDEIAWVKSLFPNRKHYLDVYDQAGLLGPRSVFAHGIHLCDDQCHRLVSTQSSLSHCPSSNLFLGSGLFPLKKLEAHGVQISMGTDVGAGTSFSMFTTLAEAYKIQQLQGHRLAPLQALYYATLGGARALALDEVVGNFVQGAEADFIVLNLNATPLLKQRLACSNDLEEFLFALINLADERAIEETYAMGRCVHRADRTIQ